MKTWCSLECLPFPMCNSELQVTTGGWIAGLLCHLANLISVIYSQVSNSLHLCKNIVNLQWKKHAISTIGDSSVIRSKSVQAELAAISIFKMIAIKLVKSQVGTNFFHPPWLCKQVFWPTVCNSLNIDISLLPKPVSLISSTSEFLLLEKGGTF